MVLKHKTPPFPPPSSCTPQGIQKFRGFKVEFPTQEFSTFQPFQTYYRKKTGRKKCREGREGSGGYFMGRFRSSTEKRLAALVGKEIKVTVLVNLQGQ